MKNSDIAAELFGEAFVDHFIRTREWEWQQFEKQVTDWELKRYFEIIINYRILVRQSTTGATCMHIMAHLSNQPNE